MLKFMCIHLKNMASKKLKHYGCLNCPRAEDFLPMNTYLYNGFGGYSLRQNGNFFWSDIIDASKPKTLAWVEKNIIGKSKADWALWEIVLDLPLRGAKWRREVKGKDKKVAWRLVETNPGFA